MLPTPEAPPRLPTWPILVVAVGAVFFPALEGGILSWDDTTYLGDPAISATTCFAERLRWVFSTSYFCNYNPLHRIGYWLQLSLWGNDPRGFHLVSLLLHIGVVLAAYALARRLGRCRGTSALVALVLALHPTRVEVVSWISAQKDLASTLLVLLGLLLYVPIVTGKARRPGPRLAGVACVFCLAVLTKSMAVTFPLLLLLLDAAFKRPLKRVLLEKIPFAAISGIFVLLTLTAAPRVNPIGGSWQTHAATVLQVPWFYVGRIVWPVEYSTRWWIERQPHLLAPGPLAGVFFLALLVQALVERQLRQAMAANDICELPLYPEARTTKRPTADQVFRLFSLAQRHTLSEDGQAVRTFHPELTALQQQVLDLLGVPSNAFGRLLPPSD